MGQMISEAEQTECVRMSELYDKKDVISWANSEDARQYIGKEGYFADKFGNYLTDWKKGTLEGVEECAPIHCIFSTDRCVYGLFLPADRVKHPEKKWRAFRYPHEITATLKLDRLLGSQITFRRKTDTSKFYIGLVTREYFVENIPEEHYLKGISIDGRHYNLDDLYENYEWLDDTNFSQPWRPFGVLENE